MSHFKTNQAQAKQLANAQRTLDRVAVPPVILQHGKDKEGSSEGFPAQYQTTSVPPFLEKADVGEFIGEVGAGNGKTQVVLEVTDEDVKRVAEKEMIEDQIKFDQWITDNYIERKDPAQTEWIKHMYPEYFESRREEKNELHRIRSKVEDIMIDGPETKEDLFLLFRLSEDEQLKRRLFTQTGYQEEFDHGRKIKRGLLNRFKYDRVYKGVVEGKDRSKTILEFLDGLKDDLPPGQKHLVKHHADIRAPKEGPEIQRHD